jgi:hypothetical protein
LHFEINVKRVRSTVLLVDPYPEWGIVDFDGYVLRGHQVDMLSVGNEETSSFRPEPALPWTGHMPDEHDATTDVFGKVHQATREAPKPVRLRP